MVEYCRVDCQYIRKTYGLHNAFAHKSVNLTACCCHVLNINSSCISNITHCINNFTFGPVEKVYNLNPYSNILTFSTLYIFGFSSSNLCDLCFSLFFSSFPPLLRSLQMPGAGLRQLGSHQWEVRHTP